MEFIAQGIGIVAMVLSATSFQMKTKKMIIIMQTLTAIAFAVHYFMIDAAAAAVVNVIAIVRNITFYKTNNAKAGVVFFAIVMALGAFLSNMHPVSLLMSVAMIFNTLSLSMEEPINVRKLILVSTPFTIVYNVLVFSIGGIINDVLVAVFTVVTLVLETRKK